MTKLHSKFIGNECESGFHLIYQQCEPYGWFAVAQIKNI